MSTEIVNNERCRVFLEDVTGSHWQLFALNQDQKDGSIYLESPDFRNYEWLSIDFPQGKPIPIKIEQDQNGHLSFHGSGQTHIRAEDHSKKLVIKGQYLLKPESREISLKHLFTVMPRQLIPQSALSVYTYKSDQLIRSKKVISPFVAVVFALPRKGLNINFQGSMNIDEMEEVPGGFLGWHLFPLIHHDIFIFFYYTKYMTEWPRKNMLQYLDGVLVPVFKGRPNRMLQVDFVIPEYKLERNVLSITVNLSKQEGA